MKKILSYPKADAPYQSCWLIMTKALIINRICLKTVLVNLQVSTERVASNVDMGTSLEDLVSRLNARLNLPSLVLEQACISSHFQSLVHGCRQSIRHCQICISLNYHSSLFQNPLLERCPVHGQLLNYCRCCTNALVKNGVFFTRPLIKQQACEHLRSLARSRVPMVKLSESDSKAFELLGDEYRAWLDGIKRLNLGAVSDVLNNVNDIRDLGSIEFYFEYVRSRIGLPFDLYWQSDKFRHEVCQVNYTAARNASNDSSSLTPVNFLSPNDVGDPTQNPDPVATVGDVITCIKSMRRHFFKNYITPHRKCFNAIKKLSHGQLNILNFSNRCTCVSAYCAWLVSSGGVSTLPEHSGVRSVKPMEEIYELILRNPSGLRSILITQFVSFFDVWGALETANADQKKYSDIIITRASIPNESFACMNASYTLTHRDKIAGRFNKEKSYIISPRQLKFRSQERCLFGGQQRILMLVETGSRNVYVPSSHGIMRFVDGRGSFQNTLVISIW